MKKSLILFVCLSIVLTLMSCDNKQEQDYEALKIQIKNLENEVRSLQESINEENPKLEQEIIDNHGTLINAFYRKNNVDMYLGMDKEGDNVSAIYLKTTKGLDFNKFYIYLGYENGGTKFFDCLINPQFTYSYRFAEYNVDSNKYEIVQLFLPKIKYTETTSMMIIMIDNKGKEYSQYIASYLFESDV